MPPSTSPSPSIFSLEFNFPHRAESLLKNLNISPQPLGHRMISNLSLSNLPQLYPLDVLNKDSSVFVFINGVLQDSQARSLQQKIDAAAHIILVDGGVKHFLSLLNELTIQLKPACLIGDLDSISKEASDVLTELYPDIPIHQCQRDKDYTDFEGALQMLKLHAVKEVLVVAGLGNRLDQSLGNLLVILRKAYRGRISFLWNENERLVSIGNNRPLQLNDFCGSYLKLFPIDGNFEVREAQGFENDHGGYLCTQDQAALHINGKTALCLIRKEKGALSSIPSYPVDGDFHYEFFENQDTSADLGLLFHLIEHPHVLKIITSRETVVCVDPTQKLVFPAVRGQTISLVPFSGEVSGIKTEGLHWELNEGTLSKNFISISNIATGDTVSISVTKGKLLCIVNNFRDMEMIDIVMNK